MCDNKMEEYSMNKMLYGENTAGKKAYLGIELGSTRIKAVLMDDMYQIISTGGYNWESTLVDGIWSYSLGEAAAGFKAALRELASNMREDVSLQCVGISGMMHGYLAFDEKWELLTPFRTWQNTMTREASEELTQLLQFNIPQRLSIAHLYHAILNEEAHLPRLRHMTTLAGYLHYLLTGVNAVCVDEASGMFPIDSDGRTYDRGMIAKTEALFAEHGVHLSLEALLPEVKVAGEKAGNLTEAGYEFLEGLLPLGVPFAPATGDGGTGMVATNSVAPRTGNVSAGTSIFADIVLERPLKKLYPEIDIVTTPAGRPVAEVHGNNCTADINMWVKMFGELLALFGCKPTEDELFRKLYEYSLRGEADCSSISVINYLAGECVTHLDEGRPMVVRRPDSELDLANFIRAHLYGLFATLKSGIDLLLDENICIDRLMGHGGVFKTKGVGQRYLAAACNAEVTCMENAGEGGPYGMAILCAYMLQREEGETLEAFLEKRVFANTKANTVLPEKTEVEGFERYMERFEGCIKLGERALELGL